MRIGGIRNYVRELRWTGVWWRGIVSGCQWLGLVKLRFLELDPFQLGLESGWVVTILYRGRRSTTEADCFVSYTSRAHIKRDSNKNITKKEEKKTY
jgi:hypothetical protein